jgi:hypothetical protein
MPSLAFVASVSGGFFTSLLPLLSNETLNPWHISCKLKQAKRSTFIRGVTLWLKKKNPHIIEPSLNGLSWQKSMAK